MSEAPVVVWFRQDLRLADNPALQAALALKRPLVLVYVLDDETPGRWRPGGASRWWLHKSLKALSADIAARGGALYLRRGDAAREVQCVVAESGARTVFWNRCYEPFATTRDARLKEALCGDGVEAKSCNASLLFEPWTIKTQSGAPFKVFTPFWRACLRQASHEPPTAAPHKLPSASFELRSENLDDWRLLPSRPNWAAGFEAIWSPGEAGARKALGQFIEEKLACYPDARDELGHDATSRLSPHLHWGEISPRQVRSAVEGVRQHAPHAERGADKFLSELGWREFSYNLLFNWPKLPEQSWKAQFEAFPWRQDTKALEAWRRGRTGYPVVDAGMRELWTTGYMHNRVRMIAASFLIKHLLIDWREGEAWFWDTLVDADLANNAASWQWVAGSGADASPYFRIFNPITQGERLDRNGAYVRRWLPELAKLPNGVLHRPWEASADTLKAAGVELGRTYPVPIVDHTVARARALAAFASLGAGS